MRGKYQLAEAEKEIERLRIIMQSWQVGARRLLDKHVVQINAPMFPQDIAVLLGDIQRADLGDSQ